MIPKTIHYCWFGRKEKPKLALKCIASWRKYCPDYEIIEWNEGNFDLKQHPYLQWCYAQKKWAFLSDYVRLLILQEHGGIYLDTDVELVRPLDDLLAFNAYFGFEGKEYVATGLGFGCTPRHPAVCAMSEVYGNLKADKDGNFHTIPCPRLNTKVLLTHGLIPDGNRQTVLGAEILPNDYLNPYDDPTGRLNKTKNTYSIHWYGKSWMDKKTIWRSRLTKPFHRIFGNDVFNRFRKN